MRTPVRAAVLAFVAACSPDGASDSGGPSDAVSLDIVLGGADGSGAAVSDASETDDAAPDSDVARDSADDAEDDTGAPDTREPDTTPDDPDPTDSEVAPDAVPDVPPDVPSDPGPDTAPPTAAECFADQLPSSGEVLVDYDAWGPTLGRHCMGTDHQDIVGVERVIFAGDSVTVGTPPTLYSDWYRNRLATALAARFDLEPPDVVWQNVDVVNGVALSRTSGDFASCAKWGARTDDITSPPHQQIQTCAPEDQRDKVTLIVMTVGGNDFFSWAQDLVDGVPIETLWGYAEQMVADMEASIHWVVDEPSPFPNGAYVVFASNFEFTDVDSANDFATCPGAGIISMDTALVDPRMTEIGAWVMSEYMRIAVETGTDMIFMGEGFCGHGHMRDDPEGRCYRGPGEDLWLDLTCLHPSAAGHAAIAEMFLAVIDE